MSVSGESCHRGGRASSSVLDPMQTFARHRVANAGAATLWSRGVFDHLVGEREQSRRHGEAEALAVLRFRTISNLVGSWTGSSAGFAPRRIELLF